MVVQVLLIFRWERIVNDARCREWRPSRLCLCGNLLKTYHFQQASFADNGGSYRVFFSRPFRNTSQHFRNTSQQKDDGVALIMQSDDGTDGDGYDDCDE